MKKKNFLRRKRNHAAGLHNTQLLRKRNKDEAQRILRVVTRSPFTERSNSHKLLEPVKGPRPHSHLLINGIVQFLREPRGASPPARPN